MIRISTFAALIAAALVPTARAQQSNAGAGAAADRNQQQSTSASGKSAVSDALFAAAAGSGGLAEVAISELGVQKATDPDLKKFSQEMIADHTRMNSELKALASQKGVALPPAPDVRAQFCHQSLAGLSGQEFDKCYAKAQLVIHMDSAAMFEAEAERGQDPDMKALAAKSLPKIKHHLTMIKPIAMKYMEEKAEHETAGK
jgi:putative membrane protein